jgi:nucleoside-diphosphate-sugar epimerase
MSPVLVTGGAGFFGSLLKNRLLKDSVAVVSLDLEPDETTHPLLTLIKGDMTDGNLVGDLFDRYRFNTVYHCAAILAHAIKDKSVLWRANVDGTRLLAENAKRCGTRNFVFTSSNCLWGNNLGHAVREDDAPRPVEIYGRSKWEAEKILRGYDRDMNVTIIRCPTIIDEGRLGLLTILFDFIRESRKVWMIGKGANRYQFIYGPDLAEACILAVKAGQSNVFNIGSDDVKSLREVFQFVIDKAGTQARIVTLPKAPMLAGMKLAYALGLSPLGPYQYKMIAEDFVFANDRIKTRLQWQPTLTNEQMLWLAYRYYTDNLEEIAARRNVSAHRQQAKMGIIRLLKWLS